MFVMQFQIIGIGDIHLLLGNDLAGDKDVMKPIHMFFFHSYMGELSSTS